LKRYPLPWISNFTRNKEDLKMGKKRSARLQDSAQVKGRTTKADELNCERMQIKVELEELMREYARLTGFTHVKNRPHRVGDAPNDWKK
jgi:hypothetical protein